MRLPHFLTRDLRLPLFFFSPCLPGGPPHCFHFHVMIDFPSDETFCLPRSSLYQPSYMRFSMYADRANMYSSLIHLHSHASQRNQLAPLQMSSNEAYILLTKTSKKTEPPSRTHLARVLATFLVAGADLSIGNWLRVGLFAIVEVPHGQRHLEEHVARLAAVRRRAPSFFQRNGMHSNVNENNQSRSSPTQFYFPCLR